MHRIRVVIANMPRLLHDIVYTVLAAEPDIELDAVRTATTGALTPNATQEADVMIVAEPAMAGMDYEALLYSHPRLRMVAIAGDGKDASLYELRPCRTELRELSPQSLIDAVRGLPKSRNVS